MRHTILVLLLPALLLPFPLSAAEYLTYVGATTLERSFMPEASSQFRKSTGISLKVLGGNSDAGIAALLAGDADIAGSGRFLSASEKRTGLVETLLGWDAVAVLVHPSNPVQSLSLAQLRKIFSGQIQNWREVGGKDGPILVVTSPPGSGVRALIREQILQGNDFTRKEIVSPLVADSDRHVAIFPSAICAVSASMMDRPGTRPLRVEGHAPTRATVAARRYPLVKPLLLITRGAPAGRVGRFVAFAVSEPGQKIIARHFFPAN